MNSNGNGSVRNLSFDFRRSDPSRRKVLRSSFAKLSRRGMYWEKKQARVARVRSVDSSLDRLQVKVSGLTDRYAIACNGRRVPLHPTGKPGEAVAGVRYRAWLPTSCLHPTIPVHTPLVFDIVDQWNDLVVGGATFHGSILKDRRTAPAPPMQQKRKAAARNASRARHTPQPESTVPEEEPNPFFPMTLDLRVAEAATPRPHDYGSASNVTRRSDRL